MKILISLILFTSVFAQTNEVDKSSKWGVYAGYQSLQISGIEDDASEDELNSFSTERLGSYYIGLWRNTDWKIGSLLVLPPLALPVNGAMACLESGLKTAKATAGLIRLRRLASASAAGSARMGLRLILILIWPLLMLLCHAAFMMAG